MSQGSRSGDGANRNLFFFFGGGGDTSALGAERSVEEETTAFSFEFPNM